MTGRQGDHSLRRLQNTAARIAERWSAVDPQVRSLAVDRQEDVISTQTSRDHVRHDAITDSVQAESGWVM
jgi:hypothetical protein